MRYQYSLRRLALCCLFAFAFFGDARAAWRTAGEVKSVARQPDGAVLTLSSGARVAVTFRDVNVVRVRLAPRGQFERDFSYAVEEKARKSVAAIVNDRGRDEVEIMAAGGARVVVNRRPFLVTVYDAAGRVVVADDPLHPASFDPDTGAVETSKRRDDVETYYGFGEKSSAQMSRDHQRMVMWNWDAYRYGSGTDPIYQSIGFFVALNRGRAYGVFQDNTYRAYFDMGSTMPERYTFGAAGGELNYYVFTGGAERSPKNILRDYTDLTGRAPLPPQWALGYQQSRYSYFPEARLREIARRFRAEKIPCDVLYLDIDYMDGYRVFTWDKTRFPAPEKMLSDLRADGFRVVTIVDPGIKADENYGVYKSGQEQNVYVKRPSGAEFQARVWPGICAFPDFTDPKARQWFGAQYRKSLDEGVSGFWNDMNEPATFPDADPTAPELFYASGKTFPPDTPHAGDGLPGNHTRYHNVYGMQMARSTYEGLRSLRPDARPLVITRAGYAGVQRFSSVWTGDNSATWEHLALTVPMLTNLGVSGVAFVGADVGGFAGGSNAELYTRWLQAAALTPFLRTHAESGTADQEPFSYGDDYTKINRRSIELRYQLLPYLYTLFREHQLSGAPVMRPLWFEYPADARTYLLNDQYLVGRDLLVAPVMHQAQTKRRVYFPKGDAWVDWWTGQRYEGGTDAEVAAPLDRLPLFARAGTIIPTQAVVQHTGEMRGAPLMLTVIEGGDGAGAIFQDAGDGYAYQRAEGYRTTNAILNANTVRLTNVGNFAAPRPFAAVEFVGVNDKPRAVRADGRDLKNVSFDRERRRARATLPDANTREIVIAP